MLWLIDTCQNNVLTGITCHIVGSSLKLSEISFFKLIADQVLVFDWIASLSGVNVL